MRPEQILIKLSPQLFSSMVNIFMQKKFAHISLFGKLGFPVLVLILGVLHEEEKNCTHNCIHRTAMPMCKYFCAISNIHIRKAEAISEAFHNELWTVI